MQTRRKRHCFSSHSYLKIIYKENPIEMKNSAYWFKFLVIIIEKSFIKMKCKTFYIKIIYKENPIGMKNSAYWFKCTFVSYYLHGNSIEKRKIRPSARPHNQPLRGRLHKAAARPQRRGERLGALKFKEIHPSTGLRRRQNSP
ncbi:MAG: hypothetical protein AAFR83_26405 [Cyanobacteria bacterium J06629_18]